MKKTGKAAAFYDLEGTLVATNLVHTLGFYAKRQQGLWQTAKKSVGTLAKLPFFGITDLYSRNVFNEVFFRSYEGFSQDRLRYFSDELFGSFNFFICVMKRLAFTAYTKLGGADSRQWSKVCAVGSR